MLILFLLWHSTFLLIIIVISHPVSVSCLYVYFRFLVPVSMIICNDIMAYVFGFFFGKTPLIKLSPKKTWEGFIGGAFSTVVYGLVVCYLFALSYGNDLLCIINTHCVEKKSNPLVL